MTQDNQDSPLPVCIDLASFGQKMSDRDDRITGLLKRINLVQSCHSDVKSAFASIVALDQWLQSDVSAFTDEQSLTIQSALLTKAIILYARATHGSAENGGRGSSQLKSKLPDNLIVEHDIIIDLRNRAIVHSHLGKQVGDRIWEEQQLLLVENGDGYKPMHTTRTTQIDYKAVVYVKNLLSFALDHYHRLFIDLSSLMVERMHSAGFTEEEMLAHSIDPTPYFSNEATFKQALANIPENKD